MALAVVCGRRYFDCPTCRLVHLHPEDRVSPDRERAEYELHQNRPHDPGYRRFLGKLSEPLLAVILPGKHGLDYGSGPGPTLSLVLEEAGMNMRIYDPFFAPDRSALDQTYDFVTCTETAEHFFAPNEEFERLARLVRPGGLLAVMTEVLTPERDFSTWAYARDVTHVCFYRAETWLWLAERLGAQLSRPHPNVAFFRLGTPNP